MSEYDCESDLQPLVSSKTRESEIADEEPDSKKDAVSTNPLDIAKSSSDDENVPIWMRKAKKEHKRSNRTKHNKVCHEIK